MRGSLSGDDGQRGGNLRRDPDGCGGGSCERTVVSGLVQRRAQLFDAGALGADSPQADTTPSAASAAPPASTPRLLMGRFVSRLMTGAALSTATSCHQKDAATKAGETLNGVITASFVIPGVSLVATPAAACRRDTGSRPGGASAR